MRRRSPAWRRMLPVLAVLVLIGLVAGAALLAAALRSDPGRSPAGGSAGDAPPVLRLTAAQGDTGEAGAPADLRPDGGQGRKAFRLAAVLPAGPTSAPAYRLAPDRAAATEVTRVGGALGLAGEPRRSGPGWVLESASGRLVVPDGSGLPWTYGAAGAGCLPPLPTGDSGSVASCALPGSGAAPAQSVPAGRAAALLRRLGPPDAAIRRAGATWTAVPSVGGRTTLGFQTTVTVDPTGRVTSAAGFLARPARLAEYPLISAREAFRRLLSQPRMLALAELCMVQRGRPGCIDPPPAAITEVSLGLQLVADRSAGQLLVPAWLFRTRPDAAWYARGPIGVIAVADRYLDRTDPRSRPPGTRPPATAPPATEPGSAEPAPPGGESGPG